jgi:hypothetical protein
MKRIAIIIPAFLAVLAFGLWSCSRTPARLVLTVPSQERAKYKENFQEVRKWAELNGDYATYTLADPQPSISLRNISLDVVVKIETAATPGNWTDKEFQTHLSEVTQELTNKLRTDLIESLKSKCEVADNVGQMLFIIVYIDDYNFGSGKGHATFRPAIFLFDTRAKKVLWFLNQPVSSIGIGSDELVQSIGANIRRSLGLDTQAHKEGYTSTDGTRRRCKCKGRLAAQFEIPTRAGQFCTSAAFRQTLNSALRFTFPAADRKPKPQEHLPHANQTLQ